MSSILVVERFNDMASIIHSVYLKQQDYKNDKIYHTPYIWDGNKSIKFNSAQEQEYQKLTREYYKRRECRDPRFTV
jgi:hypothetical protein